MEDNTTRHVPLTPNAENVPWFMAEFADVPKESADEWDSRAWLPVGVERDSVPPLQ